ncbi:MAG: aminomethyl-transferring glycine dehydrogenase subunit GcvPA [Planctomycetes bacterium]|nr:aminomethyl-transferring glycine dehydrogenase subunit GcvPA [Planctomycetota bacterium]
MDYIPNAPDDVASMLSAVGASSLDELFAGIPENIRLKRPLRLPQGFSEQELWAHMVELSARNLTTDSHRCFLGGGAYAHFIPAAVEQVAGRGEWVTSYTPYQAEASQGSLQAIFEYQTLICELTGLDVANASHYDGSTALAEAVAMSLDASERTRVVLSSAVNPQYRAVLRTLFRHSGLEVVELQAPDGATATDGVADLAAQAAAVVVQSPNYFGVVEDLAEFAKAAHAGGALAIASVNPVCLGILESPGACEIDIAVGDAQPFGIETSYGGPWCGFMAAKKHLIRRMPGRMVGQTVDASGRRAFCLTLQAREQHIRREKASSNICTNQALMALRATLTLSGLGREGVRRMATTCVQRAHELEKELAALPGVRRPHSAPFFHEFVIQTPMPVPEFAEKLARRGFLAGVDLQRDYPHLPRAVLLCATERNTRQDVQALAAAAAEILQEKA